MDLFTIFFPEQAEVKALRGISKQLSKQTRKTSLRAEDSGTLALVLLALIKNLIDKDILSHEDLMKTIKDLDIVDGKADGSIDVESLRAKFELPKPKPVIRSRSKRRRKS